MEDQLDPFLVTPNTIWPVATILEMTISGTVRLIKFAFGSGVGFLGSADRMVLFLVQSNTIWRP